METLPLFMDALTHPITRSLRLEERLAHRPILILPQINLVDRLKRENHIAKRSVNSGAVTL